MANKKTVNMETEVNKAVNDLLVKSEKEGATEIYIEPKEDLTYVRIRVKSEPHSLKSCTRIPKKFHQDFVDRIKTLTGSMKLDIKQVPQEGKIRLRIKKVEHSFYVLTIPTIHGETVVIKNMANWVQSVASVEQICMDDKKLYNTVNKNLERKNGMILITGMPGSAKTNVACSVINEIKGEGKKIFTIEDPVELMNEGVEQIQVNNKVGFDYKTAINYVLKSEADALYVSDIENSEVAQTLFQASLGGELVISQLMVPDSVEALFYFSQMGIKEYITGNAVKFVINSVLEKSLCKHCKQKAKHTQSELKSIGLKEAEIKKGNFYKANGCAKCEKKGYKGRFTILEILEVNSAVSKAFINGATHKDVTKIAQKEGVLYTRKENALRLFKEGYIDLETAKNYI